MDIKILGSGCPNCAALHQRTIDALAALELAAEVQKVEDPIEIAKFLVLTTPALVVNGKVKVAGRVPVIQQISRYIMEEMPR